MINNLLRASPSASGAIDVKAAVRRFMADFSSETTPGHAARIADYREILRPNAKVNVTFLPGSAYQATVETCVRLRREGFQPVPHIAARALESEAMLRDMLRDLTEKAGVEEILLIAGGQTQPVGPFSDTMQLLARNIVADFDLKRVGVAGHPEGSPDIADQQIDAALAWKNAFAAESDAEFYIVTQFCFDADQVIAWEQALRARGNRLPIRIGIPGPATLKALINYARICGIGNSARVLTRQGRNLTKLMTVSEPNQMIVALARYCAETPDSLIEGTHLYPLGGLTRAAKWGYALQDGAFTLHPRQGLKITQ